jgi:RNA polymerase sigma factor (sigma-70 family)
MELIEADLDARPDCILLAEFVATQAEDAFAELVRRHGRLVLRTCCRVLGRIEDAEDAAQAVFLTLAQNAGKLKRETSLAGWLHRVAWRVGLDSRKMAGRRRQREQEARLPASQVSPEAAAEQEEYHRCVDQEVQALPAKYRLPVILHHLEGHTKEETAHLLRENAGTVSTRLDRARRLLRDRLVKRGLVLSAGTLTMLLAQAGTAAEFSLDFLARTTKAAGLVATGKTAAAELVSVQAVTLTQGAMNMLWKVKIKKLVGWSCAGLVFAVGMLIAIDSLSAENPPGISLVKPGEGAFVVGPCQVEPDKGLIKDGLTCKYIATGIQISQILFVKSEQYELTISITTATKIVEKDGLRYTLFDANNKEVAAGPLPLAKALKAGETAEVDIELRRNPTGLRLVIQKPEAK